MSKAGKAADATNRRESAARMHKEESGWDCGSSGLHKEARKRKHLNRLTRLKARAGIK